MIVAVVQVKGGSGKTTLAVNVAAALGEGCLLIDSDPPRSGTITADDEQTLACAVSVRVEKVQQGPRSRPLGWNARYPTNPCGMRRDGGDDRLEAETLGHGQICWGDARTCVCQGRVWRGWPSNTVGVGQSRRDESGGVGSTVRGGDVILVAEDGGRWRG